MKRPIYVIVECMRVCRYPPSDERVDVGEYDEGGDPGQQAADEQTAHGVGQRAPVVLRQRHAAGRRAHAAHRRRVLQQHHVHRRVGAAHHYTRTARHTPMNKILTNMIKINVIYSRTVFGQRHVGFSGALPDRVQRHHQSGSFGHHGSSENEISLKSNNSH